MKGPDPEKDKIIRWRCLDLQAEIARRFSVRVHESTVGKWLRQFGLTRLQARPCHPKSDHVAQDSRLPSFSHHAESIGKHGNFREHNSEPLDQRQQPRLRHIGDQIVEHAPLPE